MSPEPVPALTWLKFRHGSDMVECVSGRSSMMKPSTALHGVTCRLQLIARPTHAWCYPGGFTWEVDRAYVTQSILWNSNHQLECTQR